ncbi:hypothetical protein EV363DRAFT_1150081 [Boletus edulis]|nr:hypothetical protein EV363DRAFT_1150081 [Boletus edulis]
MDDGHLPDELTPQAVVVTIKRSAEKRPHLVIILVHRSLDNYPNGTVIFRNDPNNPPSTAHLTSLIQYEHVKHFYFTCPDTAHRVLQRLSLVIPTYIRRNNGWVQM